MFVSLLGIYFKTLGKFISYLENSENNFIFSLQFKNYLRRALAATRFNRL
jgi:hypothetical protein